MRKKWMNIQSGMKEDLAGQLSDTQQCFQDREPKHFVMNVESFSMLFKNKVTRCTSTDFEVGGYKWRLVFYPNGNKKDNGEDHISLYLSISDTEDFPSGRKVEADFNLFVYNHVSHKYLTVKSESRSEFNWLKKESGFPRLLPLDLFKNPSNGYLVNNMCVFGAEIYVYNPVAKRQTLSMASVTHKNVFTWRLTRFSRRTNSHYSDSFMFVNMPGWSAKIEVYPYGRTRLSNDDNISLYLEIHNNSHEEKDKLFAVFNIRVMNRISTNHVEKRGTYYFTSKKSIISWPDLMPRSDLLDISKGFLEDDTLTVEFEIVATGLIKENTKNEMAKLALWRLYIS